jgi:hypothetical protein
VFGCKEKMIREKKMRKSIRREKKVRNRVDSRVGCYKRKRREIEEISVDYF